MMHHVIFIVKLAILLALSVFMLFVVLITIVVVSAEPVEQLEHECKVRVIDEINLPCEEISEK